jgi:uncharacterized RDD family membrane protein YckC
MLDETLDETVKSAPKRVGFGPRLGAMLLDALLLIILIPLVTWSIVTYGASEFLMQKGIDALKADDDVLEMLEKTLGDFWVFYIVAIAIGLTFSIVYHLIEGFFGASPGKMILGLQVANSDGSRANVNQFMKRWFLKNMSSVIGILNLIMLSPVVDFIGSVIGIVIFFGCFSVLSDNKLALHDIIAGTAVYKKRDIID